MYVTKNKVDLRYMEIVLFTLSTNDDYSELEVVEERVGDSEDVNDGLLLYQDEESEKVKIR